MGEGDDLLVRLTLGLLDDTSRWLAMGKRLGLPQEGRRKERSGESVGVVEGKEMRQRTVA